MGRWVAVPHMHLKPYKCVGCGGTPRDDEVEGRPNLQAYFCEGVDIDWGNSLFLCGNCVRVLGELRGMVGVGDHAKVVKKLEETESELTQTREDLEKAQDRIARMLDGVAAKKEATAARKKTSRKVSA